jgi:hypothetical protein
MKYSFTHIRKSTDLRRASAMAIVAMLCLVWIAPAQAVCACCAAMMADSASVGVEESDAAELPECHQHGGEAVSSESNADPALPNSIRLEASCEDQCVLEQTTTEHAVEPAAEIIETNRVTGPTVTVSSLLISYRSTAASVRDLSPPGLRALSTARYSASLPLLT